MLVLSRKVGQAIRIGDQIEVTVLSVSGGRIRGGVAAPQGQLLLRGELPKELARRPASIGFAVRKAR